MFQAVFIALYLIVLNPRHFGGSSGVGRGEIAAFKWAKRQFRTEIGEIPEGFILNCHCEMFRIAVEARGHM
jgi:hypothetical protein